MSEPPKTWPPKLTGTWLDPPHPHPGPLGLHFSAWSPCEQEPSPSAFDPTQFSSTEDSQPVCMLPDSTMRQFPVCTSVSSRKRKKSFRAAQDSSPWFTHGVPHKERRVYFLGMGGKPGGRSHEHPFLGAHPCHPWAEVTEALFLTQNLPVLHLIVTIEEKSMTPF